MALTRPSAIIPTRRPIPAPVRSYSHFAHAYKTLWRGSLMSSILVPVLNLLALGFGVGALVDASGGFDGLSYLAFIGPGLLATAAMTTAAEEASYPVMGAIRWHRTYFAMIATPLTAGDVLIGHLLWMLTRILMGASVFCVVLLGFGIVDSWQGVLVVPFAVLLGFSFVTPITAFAATTDDAQNFAYLYRFGVIPMVLFAGAVFPVTQLPGWMQVVAELTPTYHGVELCRGATTGTLSWGTDVAHVAYLMLWGVVGLFLARRAFYRRLVA